MFDYLTRRQNTKCKVGVLRKKQCGFTAIELMFALGVIAVALPSTSFFSRIPYVDAKRWRASGVKIAIASDFNPGSAIINNIWFACYLALSQCAFSLPEVYAGVTVNAALALGVEDSYGIIEEGKKATLVAFEGNSADDFFTSPIGDHVRHVVL